MMRKVFVVLTAAFLAFILWVIYRADLGQPTKFHLLIKDLPYGDKVSHFFLFGILALFSNLALKLRQIIFGAVSFYLGSLLVFSFAVLEELSQAFFPQRTLDMVDLISGALGILVFGALSQTLAKRLNLLFQFDE